MTTKQKTFIVYQKLSDMIIKSKNKKIYCAYLVIALNEISQSDNMVELTNDIVNRKYNYDKISDVISENQETLDALYEFVCM